MQFTPKLITDAPFNWVLINKDKHQVTQFKLNELINVCIKATEETKETEPSVYMLAADSNPKMQEDGAASSQKLQVPAEQVKLETDHGSRGATGSSKATDNTEQKKKSNRR